MATWNDVIRQVAITTNALIGAQPAALEATYSTVLLTAANFQSSIIPFTMMKDKMLNAESALVGTAAATANHPWRAFLHDVTDPLASGELMPTTGAGGNEIIGVYGAVIGEDSEEVYTLSEVQDIRVRNQNPGDMFLLPVYQYAFYDRRILHTGDEGVIVDVCVYERPDADTLDLTTDILLPDVALPAYVAGGVMECCRDDEFLQQAGRFGEYFATWISTIQKGGTSVMSASVPTVDAQAAQAIAAQ